MDENRSLFNDKKNKNNVSVGYYGIRRIFPCNYEVLKCLKIGIIMASKLPISGCILVLKELFMKTG